MLQLQLWCILHELLMLQNLTRNQVMLTTSHLVMVHIIIVIVTVNLLLA